MKGSNSVCLLCRLQVARATSKTPALPWQTQTARLSAAPSRHDAAGPGRASTDSAVLPDSNSGESQSQPPSYLRRTLSPRHGPNSNVQILPTKITGEPPSSRVDALFQQIIQEQQGLQNTASNASSPKSASVNLSLVRAIGRLQEMVASDTSVVDAYLFFRTEIHPLVQAPGTHVPQAYHRVKFALLDKLVVAKQADMFAPELPTVSEILRTYAETGELKPKNQWTVLVGELVLSIINMNPSPQPRSIVEYERKLALREAMLLDLLESWKVLSLPPLPMSPTSESQLTNDFCFPRLHKLSLVNVAKKGGFPAAFSSLFPQYPHSQLGEPVATLAIATFTLMHDSRRCSVSVRGNATQFMSKVAHLLTIINYDEKLIQQSLARTFPHLEEYVMGLWPKIRAYLRKNPVDEDEGSAEHHVRFMSDNKDQKTSAFDAGLIGRGLSHAYANRNSLQLDTLWQEFVGSEHPISEERAAQIREHPELMDSFIKARMTFNQPGKAIVAWNVLGKVGLKPSLRTWNLMLDGLRKAGNIDGIKNIWAKLAKSGMQLDTAIWTTRVAGLIDCGDIEGGLHALEEMTRLWGNGTNKTAVMPTIAPINAALLGLLRRQQHDVVDKLLVWARRKGIKPDIFTFNTILRSLIRNGNSSKDVEKLLATMQAQGVSADEATFVIILDASFSHDDARDPEDQANVVADVASAMANAGLELNMKTYGKMIYTLLRSNATAAAMAIVNHLYNQNLELSPHIYTMLVEHCFAQRPPALDAVHMFVQRRLRVAFDDIDHIFYDRVVRGYALAGETRAALGVHRRVVEAGGRVSISSLIELLRALIQEDNLKDAREMVNREKKQFEGRNPDPEEHASFWGHPFWQLATRYNLVDSPLPSPSVPSAGSEANGTVAASQSPHS